MRLFSRYCAVTVGTVQVTGLRMAFKVSKSLQREPNTLELAITNLSATTRAQLQKAGVLVTVEAGYNGAAQVLFIGDARTIEHVRQGPDWETRIRCGDGEMAQKSARVNVSLGPGATPAQAAKAIAASLGLPLGNAAEKLDDPEFGSSVGSYAGGFAAHGPAATHLDRLLAGAGYTWSVQDGALQLLRLTEVTKAEAVYLSASTGLVGSPEFGEKGILKARSLLQPDLRPGRRVQLDAEAVKGLFRVEKVAHAGDTAGNDWYSDVELRRL